MAEMLKYRNGICYTMKWTVVILGMLLVLSLLGVSTVTEKVISAKEGITPPGQQSFGPGGSNYLYDEVVETSYGNGVEKYWIFEPKDHTEQELPVIVFLHGYMGMHPRNQIRWIEHLVKKGNIVIFPKYQMSTTLGKNFVPNAIAAIKDAFERLQDKLDFEDFAVVGYSLGGVIATNLAALASSEGLPQPKAVMCIQSGGSECANMEILSAIPGSTLLLSVVGDRDEHVGDMDSKAIFYGADNIPLENKDFVIVRSDEYGTPDLIADHSAPGSPENQGSLGKSETDALDYYGYWKLFDGLYSAAFYGEYKEYALGNTPEQRFMGKWSDGTPVKELLITDNP